MENACAFGVGEFAVTEVAPRARLLGDMLQAVVLENDGDIGREMRSVGEHMGVTERRRGGRGKEADGGRRRRMEGEGRVKI